MHGGRDDVHSGCYDVRPEECHAGNRGPPQKWTAPAEQTQHRKVSLMGVWGDIATWRGPSPNSGGRMSTHRGVVLHIAEGGYEGTVAWCLNQNSQVSAHFVVAKDGSVTQLVDTDDVAWCQVGGNEEWLSIENEGRSGDELTPQQIASCALILGRAHREYGIPLQLADSPSGAGLGYHGMGGGAWGGHDRCPGSPIVAQRKDVIERALGARGGNDMAMNSLMRYKPRPEVFLTDGVTARWIQSQGELADVRTLNEDGTFPLGFNGGIRVVDRASLIGRIVGPVPAGWEDQRA